MKTIPDSGSCRSSDLDPNSLAEKSLRQEILSRNEAQTVLNWPDEEILSLLSAVFRVRRKYFGRRVKLNFLVNIQSGLCQEDCSYCSQSKVSHAQIDKYRLLSPEDIVKAAGRAIEMRATRLCLAASGRGPSAKELEQLSEAVRRVKAQYPKLEICCSLGLLQEGQGAVLERAGVDAYNHNLNTSECHYGKICSTHTYSDREETVSLARSEGLSPCCGALFGLGETKEDIIDLAFRLREMRVDSIPVNFLIPVPGTAMEGRESLSPRDCLRILSLFRLVCPEAELRIAGGREIHLRSLQPLALFAANSLFVGDYLTTEGQSPIQDLEMIQDLGFEILGEGPTRVPSKPVSERVTLLSKKSRR